MTVKHLKTVQTLIEAMPWIRSFWGKVMVVQPAGVTARSPRLRDLLAADVALLRMVGMQPVVVEGGAAAEGFAALVESHGAATATLAAVDAPDPGTEQDGTAKAVGDVATPAGGTADAAVDAAAAVPDVVATAAAVPALLAAEKVPVLAAGQDPLSLAGEIAAQLGAEKLLLMNDAGGLLVEQAHETVILSECDLATVGALTAAGRVAPEVQPQLAAVRRALEAGVASCHIIDGRVEHALLLEVLTDAGCGTKVVKTGPAPLITSALAR